MNPKRHKLAVCIVLIGLLCGCSRDRVELLKEWTDIDLSGTGIIVALIVREDLDEVGYSILVHESDREALLKEIDKVSGGMCIQYIEEGKGCHYTSAKGHSVFITKETSENYQVLTSG